MKGRWFERDDLWLQEREDKGDDGRRKNGEEKGVTNVEMDWTKVVEVMLVWRERCCSGMRDLKRCVLEGAQKTCRKT